jgi:hypothetical protein
LRVVLAKKVEKTASALLEPHLGHLMRFRPRSLIVMVAEYFFLQFPQRKS